MGGGFWIPDCSNMDVMIKLIREAIGMGYTMIDTAEMYGGGCSERIIGGEAIKGLPRNELFIISKVWPTHARHDDVLKSAKASSDRLGTYIDLYMITGRQGCADKGNHASNGGARRRGSDKVHRRE